MNALVHTLTKNAEMQKWIDEDPKNRFGGMLVTDLHIGQNMKLYTERS